MAELLTIAFVYFMTINALTYALFYKDKREAEFGGWRVPEDTLLAFAFFGWLPAAKLAQRRLRHKTRKQPFAAYLNLILGIYVIGAIGFTYLISDSEFRALIVNRIDMAMDAILRGEPASENKLPERFGPGS